MNAQEEDRQKTSCPSRGFGLAAVAIGVGVGAALYYIFNKRPENPHTEGSTSEWNCERSATFQLNDDSINCPDGSYITMSEHETTDTSINQSTTNTSLTSDDDNDVDIVTTNSDSDVSYHDSDSDASDIDSDRYISDDHNESSNIEMIDLINPTLHLDSDTDLDMEWDVTTSSASVPHMDRSSTFRTLMSNIGNLISPVRPITRERSWTLEECSICFEVMLRGEEVMALPCTHNFHTHCILPWLQEKQTCPNCRKIAQ